MKVNFNPPSLQAMVWIPHCSELVQAKSSSSGFEIDIKKAPSGHPRRLINSFDTFADICAQRGDTPKPINCSALVKSAISTELRSYGLTISDLKGEAQIKARRRHLKAIRRELNTFLNYELLEKHGPRFSLSLLGERVRARLMEAAQMTKFMQTSYEEAMHTKLKTFLARPLDEDLSGVTWMRDMMSCIPTDSIPPGNGGGYAGGPGTLHKK